MNRKLFTLIIVLLVISCSRSKVAYENENTVQSIQDQKTDILINDEQMEEEDLAQSFLEDLKAQGLDAEILPANDRSIANDELSGVEYIEGQYNPHSEEAKSLKRLRDQGISVYVVKKNETLMLISYKLYGDYTRWIELAELNSNSSNDQIYAGSKIKYYNYGSGYRVNKNGSPYLIQKKDSLSKISNKVYGTYSQWRPIWKNNTNLIRDPNKIFPGFTLYYPEL